MKFVRVRIIYEDIRDAPKRQQIKLLEALAGCRCKKPDPSTMNFRLQCRLCGRSVETYTIDN
jgi:hypothetical protein